jgi:nucleoside-diphosphate-sugar epimerase
MAIIGNGDIAKALREVDVSDLLFFASGVSNSREIREEQYKREVNLLLAQDRSKHIVYFSSLSIFYARDRYQEHKRHMERLVKKYFRHYTIVRLGNLVGGSNPNTIINFFKRKIEAQEDIEVQDTYRYIVGKAEFKHWISLIPYWNCELNITGELLKVSEIVDLIKKGKL